MMCCLWNDGLASIHSWKNTCIKIVFAHLTRYRRRPPLTATPTAAASHTLAAVVNPCTLCDVLVNNSPSEFVREVVVLPFQINPAPKNPTPLGIAAATRAASQLPLSQAMSNNECKLDLDAYSYQNEKKKAFSLTCRRLECELTAHAEKATTQTHHAHRSNTRGSFRCSTFKSNNATKNNR